MSLQQVARKSTFHLRNRAAACSLARSFRHGEMTAAAKTTTKFNERQLRFFHNTNCCSQKSEKGKHRGRLSYRFIDRTRVRVSGGLGGKGSTSMYRIGRKQKRRPDGGHGGSGGSVVIVADPAEQTLRWTRPHVMAESGASGSSQRKNGRNGKNLILRVPCGVVVRRVLDYDEAWDEESKTVKKLNMNSSLDNKNFIEDDGLPVADCSESEDDDGSDVYCGSDEENIDDEYDGGEYMNEFDEHEDHVTPWGEREKVVLADLDTEGSFVVVAKGGRGGIGSSHFLGRSGPLPDVQVRAQVATPTAGEKVALELELKLIADIGLVGFPNAGKSSLLAAMSRATPYIAPYPFTTLNPLVGYIEYRDGYKVCAADVPGLIAGASEGKGKGHDFLRHLERTKALLFIVDAAGVDGRDPVSDLKTLTDELSSYGDGDMMNRRSLIVANKMDLIAEERRMDLLNDLASLADEFGIRLHGDVLGISAGVTGEGLPTLSTSIRNVVALSEADRQAWVEPEVEPLANSNQLIDCRGLGSNEPSLTLS